MDIKLLFSSYPFITGHGVTLARMTDLDLEALWDVMGDEENFRYAPTGPLSAPGQCQVKLLQGEAMFRDRIAIILGIYPKGGGNRMAGVFEIYSIDPPPSASPSAAGIPARALPAGRCGRRWTT